MRPMPDFIRRKTRIQLTIPCGLAKPLRMIHFFNDIRLSDDVMSSPHCDFLQVGEDSCSETTVAFQIPISAQWMNLCWTTL